jgi:predicted small lipoprotein YifL
MRLRTSSSIVTALAALLLLAGCSEKGPKTVPVYGTVTFVGRDAPKTCRLFFKPIKVEGLTRPAAAERSSNGSYAAKSFSTSRGLLPGTYKIEVFYYDLVPGKNPDLETSWAETNFSAGELVVDANSSGVEKNIEVPKKG